MASSLFPDPMQLWREAVSKLESEANALAAGSLESQEVVRTLHDLSRFGLSMEQTLEKVVGAYLSKVNLPSRRDVAALAQALQRIEEKLDRLQPPDGAPGVPATRPARTRRPPSSAPVPPPAAAPAAKSTRNSASRRRKAKP